MTAEGSPERRASVAALIRLLRSREANQPRLFRELSVQMETEAPDVDELVRRLRAVGPDGHPSVPP